MALLNHFHGRVFIKILMSENLEENVKLLLQCMVGHRWLVCLN